MPAVTVPVRRFCAACSAEIPLSGDFRNVSFCEKCRNANSRHLDSASQAQTIKARPRPETSSTSDRQKIGKRNCIIFLEAFLRSAKSELFAPLLCQVVISNDHGQLWFDGLRPTAHCAVPFPEDYYHTIRWILEDDRPGQLKLGFAEVMEYLDQDEQIKPTRGFVASLDVEKKDAARAALHEIAALVEPDSLIRAGFTCSGRKLSQCSTQTWTRETPINSIIYKYDRLIFPFLDRKTQL